MHCMKKKIHQKKKNQKVNNFFATFFLVLFISACQSNANTESDEAASDALIEEIQKSDQEKSDSVLNYWKNKTNQNQETTE